MNALRRLTEYLRSNGFPNAAAKPSVFVNPEDEDDEVTITDKVHVQVSGSGAFLFSVVQELDDGSFNFHPERASCAAILTDLRALNL